MNNPKTSKENTLKPKEAEYGSFLDLNVGGVEKKSISQKSLLTALFMLCWYKFINI